MPRILVIAALAFTLASPAFCGDAPVNLATRIYAKLGLPKGDGTISKELQRIRDRARVDRYSDTFKMASADTQIMLLVFKINAGVNPAARTFFNEKTVLMDERGEMATDEDFPEYPELRAYLLKKCAALHRTKDFETSFKCMNAILILDAGLSNDSLGSLAGLIDGNEFKALFLSKPEPYKSLDEDLKSLLTMSSNYHARWQEFLIAAEGVASDEKGAVDDTHFEAAMKALEACWPIPPYGGEIQSLVRVTGKFRAMLRERKRPELAEKVNAMTALWAEKADKTTRDFLDTIPKWEENTLALGNLPRHFHAKDEEEARKWELAKQEAQLKLARARQREEQKKLDEEAARVEAARLDIHAAVSRNLESADGALRLKGVEQIDKLFASKSKLDVADAYKLFTTEWGAKLIVTKQIEEFLRLSKLAILARPGNTTSNSMLLFERVRMLLKKGDKQAALSEVKAFFNLAGLDGFEEVEALVKEVLQAANPKAGTDLVALRQVRGLAKDYDREIERAKMSSYDELLALGNLMLLVDSPREAHIVFQRAMLVAPPEKAAESLDSVARAIKAEDLNTARALEWLKKAQAATLGTPDPTPNAKPKPAKDAF